MNNDTIGEPNPDYLALAAMACTIALHVGLKVADGRVNPWFIGGACAFWIGFVAVRAWRDKRALHNWGFTTTNLQPTAMICLLLFVWGGVSMAFYGRLAGTLARDSRTLTHLGLMFLIYPLWGVIQQFLVLAILVDNVARLTWFRTRRPLVVLLSAALFGLVHFFDWRLAAATFGFELFAIPLYLVYRNLWPLGVLQGWLGALFYMWVLNEDLMANVFG